jgi:2-C-methyl-D-erythritol 4-phosphate cytidylyltransferase
VAVALIVAAGSGERLGADRPKAFIMLAGKPMLEWSVEAFRAAPAVDRIVVAVPAGERAPAGTLEATGGATRSASVQAALHAAGDGDPVLIHDAARPLLSPELIARVLDELARHGCDGVVPGCRVSDTIKRARDGVVSETLDRSELWAIQTPQAFRRTALERALAVDEDVLAAATDDAWLVERAGGEIRIVDSSPDNLKVTTERDLRAAEVLLAPRAPVQGG